MNRAMERTLATNSLFTAFLLSVSGWALFHAWAGGIGAGAFVHVLIAIPSMTVCGLVFYRYSLHWPARGTGSEGEKEGRGRSLSRISIAWCFLLLATGIALAWIVDYGSLFLLAMVVAGMIFIPWTKISLCRDHFFVSVGLILIGGAVGLAFSEKSFHFMSRPLCAWMFLTGSILTVIFVILTHRNQTDRMPPSGY
jgi:hypothetical protein